MRTISAIVLSFAVLGCVLSPAARAQTGGRWTLPSDADIRQILTDRVDLAKQSVGLVVGVIEPGGRRIISYGALNQGDPRPLNGDTEFEIGSITEVFTSLILADMVSRGEVSLDDPAAKFLPRTVKMPVRGGKEITLIDLATHTSGLPRLPDNMHPKDPANPLADYTAPQMYDFLGHDSLTHDIGANYEYSALGMGLLGHVLALRTGKDYDALVRERLAGPLALNDTAVVLTPAQRARLAAGHDANLKPAANAWDLPALAGAGALRSTANDLLTLLGAELGITDSSLKAAMDRQVLVRRPINANGAVSNETGLGWEITTRPRSTLTWRDGATGGTSAFAGFDPDAMVGVVVLSNANTGVNDIGIHLLAGTPLAKPAAGKP